MVDISNIQNFSVIGSGTMGHEIAQVALMAGFKKVVIYDLKPEIIERAAKKIDNNLKRLETKGILSEGYTAESLMNNLIIEIDLNKAVANADFIFEAIPEKMELKKKVFEQLGQYSPENAILATNTSTMSITEIASNLGDQIKLLVCIFLLLFSY